MECLICNEEVIGTLWCHLRNKHKLTYKEYYDLHLKSDTDGICKYCGNVTKFKKR